MTPVSVLQPTSEMPAKAKMTQEEADARWEALEKERAERGETEAYDPDADDRDKDEEIPEEPAVGSIEARESPTESPDEGEKSKRTSLKVNRRAMITGLLATTASNLREERDELKEMEQLECRFAAEGRQGGQ